MRRTRSHRKRSPFEPRWPSHVGAFDTTVLESLQQHVSKLRLRGGGRPRLQGAPCYWEIILSGELLFKPSSFAGIKLHLSTPAINPSDHIPHGP